MKRQREKRMTGVKDEEKGLEKREENAEKGGLRAPPRNRMALYEQFSFLSQRNISDLPSICSLPPNTSSSAGFVPSFSSSPGSGRGMNPFTPFCNTSPPSHLTEKLKSASYNGIKSNTAVGGHDRKMTKAMNCPGLNAKGSLPSSTKSNSFQPYNFSNFRNFSLKNMGSSESIKVPTPRPSGADASHENTPRAYPCLSLQLHTTSRKPMKGSGTMNEKSREHVRNLCEEDVTESQSCHNRPQGSDLILSARDKALVGTSLHSLTKVTSSELLKRKHRAVNQEIIKTSSLNNMAFRESPLLECAGGISRESAPKVRNESCPREHVEHDNGSLDRPETISGFKQTSGIDRCDNVSDSSMMDSESALSKSPDDVVKLLGEKQFWKIRTAIITQHRIFAMQVFELHRLLKVQKLMARSPNLFLEDGLNTGKPISVKKSSTSVLETASLVKPDVHPQKPNPRIEFSDEHLIPKLPLPSVSKELMTRQSYPVATNGKPSPWCFPAHGNQWLVPLMSPSEGLVYKPCTGPCPQNSGFMTHIYGHDFFNTAFGFPASHQLNHAYFPPYGMPVLNSSVSGTPFEQMNPFSPVQSSCSMSSHISPAIPCYTKKPQGSKDSEVQESAASSPPERPKCDVLPLFPTQPTHQSETNDHGNEHEQQPLRAIKVVPHNPRSASESIARIFESIQEGNTTTI